MATIEITLRHFWYLQARYYRYPKELLFSNTHKFKHCFFLFGFILSDIHHDQKTFDKTQSHVFSLTYKWITEMLNVARFDYCLDTHGSSISSICLLFVLNYRFSLDYLSKQYFVESEKILSGFIVCCWFNDRQDFATMMKHKLKFHARLRKITHRRHWPQTEIIKFVASENRTKWLE